MALNRILLVDDDEVIRFALQSFLEAEGFHVTGAPTVAEALKLISSETFDVLLSDLHMPGHGDGLTVVSAMRHASPHAVTILFSAFPEMEAATHAILLQTDQIVIKPMNPADLVRVVRQRIATGAPSSRAIESIATILDRTAGQTTVAWLARVHEDPTLTLIDLTDTARCAHLPQVFRDIVIRLNSQEVLGSKKLKSGSAMEHGIAREAQQYTAAMMVEESRILQVSIFETLQGNLANIDFSILLLGVMTIADEVDSQLSQAMESYSVAALSRPAA